MGRSTKKLNEYATTRVHMQELDGRALDYIFVETQFLGFP